MPSTAEIDTAIPLSRGQHRTLAALFAHPMAHNLAWTDVLSLFNAIGSVEQKSNHEYLLHAAGQSHAMNRPHGKHLSAPELLAVRRFATQTGWSPEHTPQPTPHHLTEAPTLLVAMDHHQARIFHIDVSAPDPSAHSIRPYDPHHFLHHLKHKDQPREHGQRAHEDATYYGRIAAALNGGGHIVVAGHGTGKSNAAHHLADYLRDHHPETYDRVVSELGEDLDSLTDPQLLAVARRAWPQAMQI